MAIFANDVALSLVDDSFIFTTQNRTEPLVLPAYVAVQTGTNRLLAYGEEAKCMLDRAPDNISVVRILKEGLVADSETAQFLFRHGLKVLFPKGFWIHPRAIVVLGGHGSGTIPAKHMATAGGAREVFLMELGMASAIGMGLNVQMPEINAVITVSDDWFDFTIISLAGVLASATGAIGTKAFVEDIQNHCSLQRQFRPDPIALEAQLMAGNLKPDFVADLPGWDVWNGRSEQGRQITQTVSRETLTIGMMPSLVRMTERIKVAIRSLTNEKLLLFNRVTIHATGSAIRMPGLAKLISDQLGHSITPFASSVHPSIEGGKVVLKELDFLHKTARPAH